MKKHKRDGRRRNSRYEISQETVAIVHGNGSNNFRHLQPKHICRVEAHLIVDEGLGKPKLSFQAAILINDINYLGTMIFSKHKFPRDQQVTLNIPTIRNFYIQGRVVACKELSLNPGLLTANSFPYRLELEWVFRSDVEKAAVVAYCTFLAESYLGRAA